jgi:hypothetical protein
VPLPLWGRPSEAVRDVYLNRGLNNIYVVIQRPDAVCRAEGPHPLRLAFQSSEALPTVIPSEVCEARNLSFRSGHAAFPLFPYFFTSFLRK